MIEHRNNPAVAILPAQPHWFVLVETHAPDQPLDYAAEPILAWHIDVNGKPTAVTLTGPVPGATILRPDESVRHVDKDYPDFAAFLLAMRGDPWGVPVEFETSPVTPERLVAGAEACIEQGPTHRVDSYIRPAKPPKLAP